MDKQLAPIYGINTQDGSLEVVGYENPDTESAAEATLCSCGLAWCQDCELEALEEVAR